MRTALFAAVCLALVFNSASPALAPTSIRAAAAGPVSYVPPTTPSWLADLDPFSRHWLAPSHDMRDRATTVARPVQPPRLAQPGATSSSAVSITSAGFAPQTITITMGSSVVWTNQDSVVHAVIGGVPATALDLRQIVPNSGPSNLPNPVTIQGANINSKATAWVGSAALTNPSVSADGYTLQGSVPAGLSPGTYDVVVENPGGETARLPQAYTVVAANADDLVVGAGDLWADPLTIHSGESVGLGLTVHRQGGTQTLQNVDVAFYLNALPANGGTLIASGTIPLLGPDSQESVFMPNAWHTAGLVGSYELFAVVNPDGAIAEATLANNAVQATLTVLPTSAADTVPPTVTGVQINAGAWWTNQAEVTVSIAASDNPGGSGLDAMYLVEYVFNQAGRRWVLAQQAGWWPFASRLSWTLTPQPGMHYLQVWVRDGARNISLSSGSGGINYAPARAPLAAGEGHLYRWQLAPGQAVHLTLVSNTGDADLYVWQPGNNGAPDWQANSTTSPDELTIFAPVAGLYQIEVMGYTDATYTLMASGTLATGAGGLVVAQTTKVPLAAPMASSSSMPPGWQAVTQGQTVPVTLTVSALYGFTGSVALGMSGLPAEASAAWSAPLITPTASSRLSVTAGIHTPAGSYALTLSASAGGLTRTTAVTLAVMLHSGFSLGMLPMQQAITQGSAASYTASVSGLYDFSEPVTLTVSGLPAGAATAILPNPVVPTNTATITLTTMLTTPAGTHPLTLTGSGGGRTHSLPFTLSVTPHPDFGLGVTPNPLNVRQGGAGFGAVLVTDLNGFTAPVALAMSDLPAGASAAWASSVLTPDASTALTVTAALNTAMGDYGLVITGTGGGFTHTAAVSLAVALHAGFSLDVAPISQSAPQGGPAVYTVAVTGLYDFTDPVTLTLAGLPAGGVAAVQPNPVVPTGTAAITLTAAFTTPVATYTLALTGTGSGRSHSLPFTWSVTPHPDFSLAVAPDRLSEYTRFCPGSGAGRSRPGPEHGGDLHGLRDRPVRLRGPGERVGDGRAQWNHGQLGGQPGDPHWAGGADADSGARRRTWQL